MRLPARLSVSRHGVFQFRITIPKSFRPQFEGKTELRRSLGTRDPAIAKALSYGLSFAYLRAFGKARMSEKKKDAFEEFREKHNQVLDQLELMGGYGKIRIELPNGGALECDTIEELEAAKEMLGGEMPVFNWQPDAQASASPKAKSATGGISFTDAMERALADAAGGLDARTAQSYRQKATAFAAFVSNPPIAHITGDDIERFKNSLRARNLSAKSINNYLGALNKVFTKMLAKGLIMSLPTSGTHIDTNKGDNPKEPFASDHLRLIFDPARMGALTDPADFWFPFFGLFMGMRVHEIGQLRCIDLFDEEGVPALYVYRSKSPAGVRTIPLHPALIELGFLRYVDHIRGLGEERVFPHLTETKQGFGKITSKHFSEMLEEIGIKSDALSFHSTRHSFNQRLARSGVDEALRCAYIGHKYESVNVIIYHGKPPFAVLASGILPHVNFPIVNLAALRSADGRFVNSLQKTLAAQRKKMALKVAKDAVDKPTAPPPPKRSGRPPRGTRR